MEQRIIDGNKLIAIELGWFEPSVEYKMKWCGVPTIERLKKMKPEYIPFLIKEGVSEPMFADTMNYHNSWDWLMPMCKKIADIDEVYSESVGKIISENKFEIMPVWESIVRHIKRKK